MRINNKTLLIEYNQNLKNNVPKEESEARTLLILLNDSLINYVLYNKFNLFDYSETLDEYSICKMGLIKAIDKFDISKNVEFSTYAIKVMINEMYMHYRKINSASNSIEHNKISIEDCMMEDFGGEPKLQFSHNFSQDADFVEDVMLKDDFEGVCKQFVHLKPIEQKALILAFGLFNVRPMKHQDIADKFGKSRSYISKIITASTQKLYLLSANDSSLTEEQITEKYKIQKQVYELNVLVKNRNNSNEDQVTF